MSRLVSGLSFELSKKTYEDLMFSWAMLVHSYPGWGLSEIKSLTVRERENWLEMARFYRKVQRM